MKLKQGVKLRGISPELVAAMLVLEEVYRAYNLDFVVTSVSDGYHRKDSKHYTGYAFDSRTRDLPAQLRKQFCAAAATALGPEFDVLLEVDHLHVEFDPK